MLPTILAKIGLPILIEVISAALRRVDNGAAQSASKALDEVGAAMAGGLISDTQMEEANRHAEAMAQLKSDEYAAAVAEINASLRAEVASSDPYVRRMRPTFGYLMAFTWAAQMLALAYVMVFQTERAASVLDGMAALSTIWAVGLSVLGIYVYKRSEEKKAGADIFSGMFAARKNEGDGRTEPAVKPKYNE